MIGIATAANTVTQLTLQDQIDRNERKNEKMRNKIAYYQTASQCTQFTIDSAANMKNQMLESAQIELDIRRAEYQLQLSQSGPATHQ